MQAGCCSIELLPLCLDTTAWLWLQIELAVQSIDAATHTTPPDAPRHSSHAEGEAARQSGKSRPGGQEPQQHGTVALAASAASIATQLQQQAAQLAQELRHAQAQLRQVRASAAQREQRAALELARAQATERQADSNLQEVRCRQGHMNGFTLAWRLPLKAARTIGTGWHSPIELQQNWYPTTMRTWLWPLMNPHVPSPFAFCNATGAG